MDVDNEDLFFQHLRDKHLIKDYKKNLKEEMKKFNKEFKLEEKEIEDKIKQGIEDDQKHRRVVNLSIFPFRKNGHLAEQTKYYFIRADPLYELGTENIDFLILKRSNQNNLLIAGEGKGSVSNPHKVIQEVLKRKKIFEDNLRYIKKYYLGDTNKKTLVEYVISVDAIDANDINREIIKQGGGLITWKVGYDDTLSIELPQFDESKQETMSLLHKDIDLRRELKNKCKSSSKFLNIFWQSHIFSKLKIITLSTYKKGASSYLDHKGLIEILENDLFYLKPEERQKQKDLILTYATKISFLKPEGDEFRIISKWSNASGLEDDLKRKFIAYRKNVKFEEQKKELIKKIKIKFRKKQSTLIK